MRHNQKKILCSEIRTRNFDLSKRWYVEYYLETHNGLARERRVKYITSFETSTARLASAKKIIDELNRDLPPVQKKDFFERLIELGSIAWRKKTINTYSTILTSFSTFLGKRNPKSIKEADIQDYKVWLSKQGKSYNTIAKYNNFLVSLYNRAVDLGLIKENPIKKIKNIRRYPVSKQYYSDRQITIIKKEIKENWGQVWLCVQLLFYCFIRPGEQRGLKISDIDFDLGCIEIPSAISKNKKTEKVAIPSHLVKEIEQLQQYPNHYFVFSRSGGPGLIQVPETWIYKQHKQVLDKLQIRGRYSFYSWKHTGVVKCVQAGLNIRDIQNQLRHHSLDMVQEYLKNLGVLQSPDLKNKFPELK